MNRRELLSSVLAVVATGAFLGGSLPRAAVAAGGSRLSDLSEARLLKFFRKLDAVQRAAFLTLLQRINAGGDIKPAAIDFFVACGHSGPEAEQLFETVQAEHQCLRGVA